jgi:membrane protein implicated in regulation of membrane protease activity
VFLIVAVVLLVFVPWPWNVVAFAGGLIAFAAEVGFWNRKVRRKRVSVGAETLIGREATVAAPCRPEGQVRVGGELWEARCEDGADRGDEVVVTGRSGLQLVVEKLPGR